MTIYSPLGDILLVDVPITKSAVITHKLMGDYYIELPFSTASYIHFSRGSYIHYKGRKFEVMSDVYPDTSNGAYTYTLRFEAQQNHLKRCRLFWLGGKEDEVTFNNTTDLASFGKLVVANVNKFLGTDNWVLGGVPADLEKATKLVSFNGDNCWNALTHIAETFEVEWWTVEDGERVSLHFGKLEFGTEEVFRAGDVVTSIPNRQGDNANYGTRFYVFGSTRNLPASYRKNDQGGVTNHVSEPRLHLPDGLQYIDARDGLMQDDIVEQVAFFEDIYPKNTDTVTSVTTVDREIIEGESNPAYVMYCEDTPFTPDDLIEDEEFKCVFTSGSLMGREFALQIDKVSFDKKFEIIPEVETYGDGEALIIPNENLHPEAGDTFILTGVQLPEARIKEAEYELLEVGTSWAAKNSMDTSVYDCPTNPVYCHLHDKNYDLGQKVLLVGPQFGERDRSSRIQGYEKKLYDEYQATYTVGDNSVYSRFGEIEKALDKKAYSERIGVISGVGIYVIRSKYDSTLPTDYNVYSAAAQEVLFLNKRIGGNVLGKVSFENLVSFLKDITTEGNIATHDFRKGSVSGAGAALYRDVAGNTVLEADKLIVRQEATFNELIINQVTFQVGETVFSAGGCTITDVVEDSDSYRCYYDNKEGRRYSGLKEGDLARCQQFDATHSTQTKYYWRYVTAVGDDYVELSKSSADGNGVPAIGDDIVQFGNRYDITRQSAVVISPYNGGSVIILANIDTFSLANKDYIGIGTDPNSGRAYLFGYGDVLIGDRTKKQQYIEYKDGVLTINANVTLGATSDLSQVEQFNSVKTSVDNLTNASVFTSADLPALENEHAKVVAEYEHIIYQCDNYGIDFQNNPNYRQPAEGYINDLERAINAVKNNGSTDASSVNESRVSYYEALGLVQYAISDAIDGNIYNAQVNARPDLDYLKQVFPNAILDVNGASLAQLLGVKNTANNVVAGLYGGADDELNDSGFVDSTKGILMFFAGAETLQDVAKAATRIYQDGTLETNKIVANGGKIGIFEIDTDAGYQLKATEDDSAMELRGKGLAFSSGNAVQVLIRNTSSGNVIYPISVSNSKPNSGGINAGITISVSGASGDDAMGNNIALLIGNGDISVDRGTFRGFRPKVRVVTTSQTLSKYDSIICTNQNNGEITLKLPADPEDSQMYVIRRLQSNHQTYSDVKVDGNGAKIITHHLAEAKDVTDVIPYNNAMVLHYVGVINGTKYWISNYMTY